MLKPSFCALLFIVECAVFTFNCCVATEAEGITTVDGENLLSYDRKGHPWQVAYGVPVTAEPISNQLRSHADADSFPSWRALNYMFKRKDDVPPPPPGFVGSRGRREDIAPPGFVGSRGRREDIAPPGFVGSRGRRAELPPGFVGSRGRRNDLNQQKETISVHGDEADQLGLFKDFYKRLLFKKTSATGPGAPASLPFRDGFFGARG